MHHTSRQIYSHLQNAKKIVLVCHQNPDGDTLGSASALTDYLTKNNKQVTIFCLHDSPNDLVYLPHLHLLTNNHQLFADHSIDTIITIDCGDLRYAGIDRFVKNHPATIINIDHHPTNEKYGQINLVSPTASSVAEILYLFFKHNNINISRNMATALLTGLFTDTGNFSNSATSIVAIAAASQLLRSGANINLINKWTTKNQSLDVLKLWGVILERLKHKEQLDLVYTYLTKKDCENYNISDKATDGIANFLNKISGVKIMLFIKETEDNKIKGSLRTNEDDVDVAKIAKKMGGGGHKKAAGFTTTGTIEEVIEKILTNN